ncbi:hypothetical protein ACTFIY_006551 [Dictyostelium cf. discoideum]
MLLKNLINFKRKNHNSQIIPTISTHFQLYIDDIDDLKKLENVNANMLFKGDRWAISKERSRRDYDIRGLELWNMATRSQAQKPWLYEQYLREKDNGLKLEEYTSFSPFGYIRRAFLYFN